MPKNIRAEAQPDDAPASNPLPVRARLVLPLGRGGRGKTTLTRWMVERAQRAGRSPVVADADRNNATLGRFFDGVLSPPSADDRDVMDFVARLVEAQAERRFDAVLDLGGGDLTLKRLAAEMSLASWLPTLGIDIVAVHLLGPSADDLAYLQAVEDGGLLAPPSTVLVLNEAAVPPGRTAAAAFGEAVETHPILTATVARGAMVVAMPRLGPAPDIEAAGLPYWAAAANQGINNRPGLGLWRAQQCTMWLRAMEVAFAPVAEWLP